MKNPIIRVCLWILGIVALVGNLSVIFWRLVYGEDSKVQSFLLKNLAVADFIMGVYLIIIAVQDTRWQGEYFEHDVRWRGGTLCQVTGALSMLSSEVMFVNLQLLVWILILASHLFLLFKMKIVWGEMTVYNMKFDRAEWKHYSKIWNRLLDSRMRYDWLRHNFPKFFTFKKREEFKRNSLHTANKSRVSK